MEPNSAGIHKLVFSFFLWLKHRANKEWAKFPFFKRIFSHFLLTCWRNPQLSCSTHGCFLPGSPPWSVFRTHLQTPTTIPWPWSMTLAHQVMPLPLTSPVSAQHMFWKQENHKLTEKSNVRLHELTKTGRWLTCGFLSGFKVTRYGSDLNYLNYLWQKESFFFHHTHTRTLFGDTLTCNGLNKINLAHENEIFPHRS